MEDPRRTRSSVPLSCGYGSDSELEWGSEPGCKRTGSALTQEPGPGGKRERNLFRGCPLGEKLEGAGQGSLYPVELGEFYV